MNSSKKRNKRTFATAGVVIAASVVATGLALAAGKGLDVEIAYEIKALKITGSAGPLYVQGDGQKLVFSDVSGAVLSASINGGKATELARLKGAGGVAIAPSSFGSNGAAVFVLAAADPNGPCEVMKVSGGSASSFAKLPHAGGIGGGKASDCRDLEFGPSSGPFAGKLYAVTNGNASVYEIDASGKAKAFATFEKPLPFEIMSISFTEANDSKAPNSMLLGMRPRTEVAAKVGRINVIDDKGQIKTEYLVGFVAPTGWGYAPSGFGSYSGQFFIADAGKRADKNDGARDGQVYRVDNKGVVRPFAGGMVDPNCLRFVGRTMVIADPAETGKPGQGAVVVITSML